MNYLVYLFMIQNMCKCNVIGLPGLSGNGEYYRKITKDGNELSVSRAPIDQL